MRLIITIIAAITAIYTASAQVPNVTENTLVPVNESNKSWRAKLGALHRAEDTIYVVLAGQSNAWGATPAFQGDTTSSPFVQAWDGAAWVRAEIGNEPFRTPANNPSSSSYDNSNCLGLHFCKKLAEESGNVVRLILNVADGNTIANWIPASDANYVDLEDQIGDGGVDKVDIFLWHQGEADNAQTESWYTLKFDTLKMQLRAETWFQTTTPIVVGGLLPGGTQSNQTTTLEKFDYDDDVWVAYSTSEDLVNNGTDNLHFHGTSLVEFGAERYWQAYLSLPLRHTERGWAPTSGTVTSVDVSGGTTGLTTSGGPITGSGTITLAGTLGGANGGTGITTFGAANRVPYAASTTALTTSSNFSYNGTLLSILGNSNSQLNVFSLRNSNSGSSAATRFPIYHSSGTGASQGAAIVLASPAFSAPNAGALLLWNYEGPTLIGANNSEKLRATSGGVHIGGTSVATQALQVTGNALITGQTIGNYTGQYVAEFERTSGSPARVAVDNATNSGFSFKNGDAEKWVLASYVPSGTNYSFSFYNQQLTSDAFFLNGDDNYAGFGVNSSLAARLHVKGSGATSSTSGFLVENSAGTDILTVRDDQMSAFGTTPVATEKLLVRGATSDATAKAFVAERSSGTDIIGAQNDGKVSINNAAYTEALTVNGNTQTDMLVLTNQTASTATGKVVYDNGSGGTYSGTLSLGDGTHALVMAPTLIERHVLDYLVNWSTGRKGAFWTVPARFDGYKIAKAYISVTAIGAGAGDDELTIEIGGVGEGVQVITAGTHTLVMNDVINTDDVITFNITEISATPAQGLHVSLELSKL